MMAAQIDGYADALRALGLFLDQAGATGVEIGDHGDHWAVHWQEAPRTRLEPADLEALRTVARLHRGLHPKPAVFPLSQQLRTVGQLFDRMRATSFVISEVSDGLKLSARVASQEGVRTYPIEEIMRIEKRHQEQRSA